MSCVAVIPARRAERTIAATLASLRLGNAGFVERVLVVTSGDDPTADVVRAWARRDPRVELVAAATPPSAGAARNLGVALARRADGDVSLFLFIDADCRLEAGGAVRLAGELDERDAAAISARVIGEGGAVARARHILEFKEAASARPPPKDWLPPSTAMLCRAGAFDLAGGFPDLWPGEDLVFSAALRGAGLGVLRSRAVVVTHRHPDGAAEMLRHQYRLGATAAVARRMRAMPGSLFARRWWLAPLLFPGRIVRTALWQAREGAAALAWTVALCPLLIAGLAIWTAGFVAGSRREGPGKMGSDPFSGKRGLTPFFVTPFAAGRVAVVVPVFDGASLVGGCLEALTATCDAEVLVVDDASRDSSLAVARGWAGRCSDRVAVLALDRNHGFAGAVNRAVTSLLARADAPEVIVLVNQDCIVSPGWLAPLLAALADPSVAAAGARLLDVDGVTLQHAGARVEANGLTSHVGRGSRDAQAWREAGERDYVCGALFALRTSTWRRLGPFDEGYAPAYYEEVDWCLRARREGLRVVYVPDSEARHLEASCTGALSPQFLRRYHRSRMRFVVRNLFATGQALRWLRAEAAWMMTLRSFDQIRPVLRAYARVPALVAELASERRTRSRQTAQRTALLQESPR